MIADESDTAPDLGGELDQYWRRAHGRRFKGAKVTTHTRTRGILAARKLGY